MKTWLLRRTTLLAAFCILALLVSPAQTKRSSRQPAPGHGLGMRAPLSADQRTALLGVDSVTLPWFDNVEQGAGQWVADGFWHIVVQPQRIRVLSPTIFPDLVLYPDSGYLPAAFSGNNAWWFGEDSTGTFIGNDFERSQPPLSGGTSTHVLTGNLVTPPVSLLGQKRALLSFMTWWEIEGVNSDGFDLMNVEISTDRGGTWSAIGRGLLNPLDDPNGAAYKAFSSGGLGARGRWIRQYFDLSQYVGSVVLIRFRFDSGDQLYNGFRGWFIDDVSVTASVAPAPTILGVNPLVINPGGIVRATGTNFVSGAIVAVDTVAVDGAVMSDTMFTFFSPALLGTHNLTITNPDGQFATRVRAFTITSNTPPSLYLVQPDSAAAGSSVPVTISGSGFKSGAVVEIGGIRLAAQSIDTVTSTIVVQSPSSLPPGAYNVTVINPDGLSGTEVLAFKVYMPAIHVAVPGDSLAGHSQLLVFVPPVGQTFTSGVLFYRQGGMHQPGYPGGGYDSVALTVGPGSFSATIPASAVTLRGVDYWTRLRSANGIMTYPGTSPDVTPASLPVRIASVQTAVNLPAGRYRMISSPIQLDNPDVQAQLSVDYGSYNPARWRAFRWQGAENVEVTNFNAPLDPGSAYWLITYNGAPFNLRGGTTVPTGTDYLVPIDSGWNQIANPFGFPVAWVSVSWFSTVITGPYSYDGTQYNLEAGMLQPFEGYFVHSDASYPTDLLFHPIDGSYYVGVVGYITPTAATLAPGEFVLQMSAQITGTEFRDTHNYLGLRIGSSSGKDKLDAPKPPAVGQCLRLDIMEDGVPYLQDYKPADGDGQSWIIEVTARDTKGKAAITLAPAGTLPPGYEMHVLDLNNENAVPITAGTFETDLSVPNASRYYKVIMGTAAYAEKESKGLPLHPVEFSLEQNYPNPFNPSTNIRYSLAKRSDVTLEVYNALGQRVRMLFSGSQSTGTYETVWDGTNDAGGHVASGIYFFRLHTADFTAVRKLVMIR